MDGDLFVSSQLINVQVIIDNQSTDPNQGGNDWMSPVERKSYKRIAVTVTVNVPQPEGDAFPAGAGAGEAYLPEGGSPGPSSATEPTHKIETDEKEPSLEQEMEWLFSEMAAAWGF